MISWIQLLLKIRQKQMDLLLQLEQQKPALEIELVYFKDRILEKREIAMEVVGNMYDAKCNRRDHKTQQEEFEQFVFKEAASDYTEYRRCLHTDSRPGSRRFHSRATRPDAG
jgi:hypothetical protein